MWDHIIYILPNELLSIKTKESRINELKKIKNNKKCFTIIFFKKKTLTIYILYLIISLQNFLKSK